MMVKNDYRRSLIMFRSHAQGYSGHVRLERRTLMGSMFFVVNAPGGTGTLCATLVRRDARGAYFAAKLGELRRDGRGQATLAYSFDPRNIDGHPLDDYLLIAIVLKECDRCDVVLTGNVNGSREVSWSSVRAAACEVCACSRAPACDLRPPRPEPRMSGLDAAESGETAADEARPERTETTETPPAGAESAEPNGAEPESPNSSSETDFDEASGSEASGSAADSSDATSTPSEDPSGGEQTPSEETQSDTGGSGSTSSPAADIADALACATAAAVPASGGRTAGDALGIDMSAPWPGVSEQLRGLFAGQPADELMLGDGYTYVRAPMPASSGYDRVEIGVHIKDGAPDSIAYALPAHFSPEPPPGLEDYVWRGGAAEGWWTIRTDPETGERQA